MRLSTCQGRQMSLGELAVMMNLMITNIPILYLSFFKDPKSAQQENMKIQRAFL